MLAAAVLCLASMLGAGAAGAGNGAGDLPQPLFVGYHESWSENPVESASATRLANLPGYVNLVILGFARPDAVYHGDLDLSGTGLEFPFSGTVLRDAIGLLRGRHPDTRLLLSVGGSGYPEWGGFDPAALALLVRDLGLDGLDLDYEPLDPGCRPDTAGSGVQCASDATWRELVRRMRAELPRPALLAVPGWSVGAYGRGEWRDARPPSPWTGNLLGLFDSPEAAEIDLVTIMAYAADASFDPLEAFRAYRGAWSGPLALGVMVPPDPLEGPHYDVPLVAALSRAVVQDPDGGMMLYTLQRRPPEPVDDATPDAARLARTICLELGLNDCEQPLP